MSSFIDFRQVIWRRIHIKGGFEEKALQAVKDGADWRELYDVSSYSELLPDSEEHLPKDFSCEAPSVEFFTDEEDTDLLGEPVWSN